MARLLSVGLFVVFLGIWKWEFLLKRESFSHLVGSLLFLAAVHN